MPTPPSQDFDLERLGASEIGAFLLSIDFDAVDVGFSFVPNEGSAELREWVKVAKKAKQLARQVESAALDDAWLNDCLAELLTSGRCNAALRKIMSAAEHSKAESKPASPEAGTPQLEGDLERPEKIPARELITTIYDTSHPGADLRREISPCGTHVQLGASWVKTNGQLALMDVDPMLLPEERRRGWCGRWQPNKSGPLTPAEWQPLGVGSLAAGAMPREEAREEPRRLPVAHASWRRPRAVDLAPATQKEMPLNHATTVSKTEAEAAAEARCLPPPSPNTRCKRQRAPPSPPPADKRLDADSDSDGVEEWPDGE